MRPSHPWPEDFAHGFRGSPLGPVRPRSETEVTEVVAKALASGSKLSEGVAARGAGNGRGLGVGAAACGPAAWKGLA